MKPEPLTTGDLPLCQPACQCWREGPKPWCAVTDLSVHHGTVCGPAMAAIRDEQRAIRALFPDLPPDAPVEAVIARVREGERARRAWAELEQHGSCLSQGVPYGNGWGYSRKGIGGPYDGRTAIAAALAATEGDKNA